jgi:outer membrane protein, heavy metal efflux system
MRTLIFIGLLISGSMQGQQLMSLDSCLAMMRNHSALLKAETSRSNAEMARAKGAIDLPAPQIYLESPTSQFMTPGITQTFAFPTVYRLQYKQAKTLTQKSQVDLSLKMADMESQVMASYYRVAYHRSRLRLLNERDSLNQALRASIITLHAQGLVGSLAKDMAELKVAELKSQLLMTAQELAMARLELSQWCGLQGQWETDLLENLPLAYHEERTGGLFLQSRALEVEKAKRDVQLAKNKALPGLMAGYLNQGQPNSPVELRWQFGITLPIWWWQHKAEISSAKHAYSAATAQLQFEEEQRIQLLSNAYNYRALLEQELEQYQTHSAVHLQSLVRDTERLFGAGELSFAEFSLYIEQTFSGRENYIKLLHEYHALSTLIYFNQQ